MQTNNELLLSMDFEFCVIDDAANISEPLQIGPILLSRKFILVGDYFQSRPEVKSRRAEKRGFGISMFEKLCRKFPKATIVLKTSYS